MSITRRDLLARATGVVAASILEAASSESTHAEAKTKSARGYVPAAAAQETANTKSHGATREFNGPYHGDFLNQIAFPMGGIGAGMICLEGNGALSKF